jgi:hypothetical protein
VAAACARRRTKNSRKRTGGSRSCGGRRTVSGPYRGPKQGSSERPSLRSWIWSGMKTMDFGSSMHHLCSVKEELSALAATSVWEHQEATGKCVTVTQIGIEGQSIAGFCRQVAVCSASTLACCQRDGAEAVGIRADTLVPDRCRHVAQYDESLMQRHATSVVIVSCSPDWSCCRKCMARNHLQKVAFLASKSSMGNHVWVQLPPPVLS